MKYAHPICVGATVSQLVNAHTYKLKTTKEQALVTFITLKCC